jgi:hypothetical protein
MSDEQTPTPIDLLVDRLGQRIAMLTVENEWLRVQMEHMQKDAQREPMVNPILNGEHQADDAMEGVGPV